MTRCLPIVWCLGALLTGCDADTAGPTWLETPTAALPETLSEMAVFTDVAALAPADNVHAYSPKHPLWSNGSLKSRHLVVPAGAAIDPSGDAWEFPVGTILLKTFSFGAGAQAVHAETRVIRRLEDGWDYAVYLWDAAGEDATLTDIQLATPVVVPGAEHTVPSRFQCRQCHESSAAPHPVLGLNGLQLDDGATLPRLVEAGVFAVAPTPPAAITHEDPVTEQVMGYVTGNCVHCHNGSGGPSSQFDLRHDVLLANTVGVPTESSGFAAGTRVVAGDPDTSMLYLAVARSEAGVQVSPMPPIGVQIRDDSAVALIRTWIEQLPRDP